MFCVITWATLRAGGFNALGVLNLLLYYHVALALLNHHIRWLLAGFVGIEPTLSHFLASFARMAGRAIVAEKMEYSIFLLEVAIAENEITTNLTNFEFCGKIRTTAFVLHIRIKDRAHPVF